MARERKIQMISLRLPASLVARLDYVARNTDAEDVKNRSTAVQLAIESWLPGQEKRVEELIGPPPKKAR